MCDQIEGAHESFRRERFFRLLNSAVAGPFWFSQADGDVRISGCYSYPKPILLKKSDLHTDKKDSILDIKEINFNGQRAAVIFWKYGWFGYTTTLHPIEY